MFEMGGFKFMYIEFIDELKQICMCLKKNLVSLALTSHYAPRIAVNINTLTASHGWIWSSVKTK